MQPDLRKLLALLGIACFGIALAGRGTTAPAQLPSESVVVTTDNAPLQNGRELVARVRQGERLAVVRTQGDWYLVRATRGGQAVQGWISRDHVRSEGQPAAPAVPQTRFPNATVELHVVMRQADALSEQGDYERATALYERVVELAPEVFGPRDFNTGVVNHNLGNLYQELGRYREAEAAYLRALQAEEAARGKGHFDTVSTRNSLANVYTLLGRYEEAERLHRECLQARETHLGPEDLAVAQSLNNLGLLLQDVGRYAEAEQAFRRSLAIREAKLGKDDVIVASSLYHLAILHQLRGEFGPADLLLRRSLAIEEAELGKDHPEIAKTLVELANVAAGLGLFAQAEQAARRALAIVESRFSEDHVRAVSVLATLASIYQDTNRTAQAEALHLRCLRIAEAELGENDLKVAWTLNNLASLYQSSGQFARAEPLAVRSWKIKEARLGKNHPDIALALNNLGNLYWLLGETQKSREFHEQALALRKTLLGESHPDVAQSYHNLGVTYAFEQRWEQAAKNLDLSRRAVRRYVQRLLPGLPEREQLSFLKVTDAANLHLALSLGWQRRDDPALLALAASWLVNGKGLAQQALAQQALLARAAHAPQQAALVHELGEVRRRLAVWTFRTPGNAADSAERTRQIGALQERERRLSAQLGQFAAGGAEGDPWVELEAVRRALPAGAVLIEIVRFDPYDYIADRQEGVRYAAWLIFPAGEESVQLVDLGPAEPIERAIHTARQALNAAPQTVATDGEPEAETKLREPLKALAQLVLDPLLPRLAKRRAWTICPDAALWLVPWAALPLPDGRYAVETHEITHVVSGRALAQPASPVKKLQAPLVLADPDFDLALTTPGAAGHSPEPADPAAQRGPDASRQLPRFARLPATAVEARAIAPSLEQYAGVAPQMYLTGEAREGVVKSTRSPRVLTLSTHGFFLKDQSPPSATLPFSSESVDRALTAEGEPLENPLLRCGLVLAGCNHRDQASPGAEDGVLTGLEIVGTDLRGTQLVVLSACETGIGEVRNGEGVAGLRQAFQLAGAESVVASLWSVPDLETARLMKAFFEHLAAGKSEAAAMRAAQLERIESRRERSEAAHPFYWAAFTVTSR